MPRSGTGQQAGHAAPERVAAERRNPIRLAESRHASIASRASRGPITFSTSTREEYQLVYDTLTLAGLSDVDARGWIENARESGLESRFTLAPWGTEAEVFQRIPVRTDHIVPMP